MTNTMNNDVPVITQKTAESRLQRQVSDEALFDPSDEMSRAKARFYRRLEERSHLVDREAVLANEAMLIEFAGTKKVLTWASKPGFSAWFLDENNTIDYVMSLRDQAIRTIHATLLDPELDAKDRLKAADMILNLTDMYPGRKSEVRFLDERLNGLTETETEREIAKLKGQLGKLPMASGVTNED